MDYIGGSPWLSGHTSSKAKAAVGTTVVTAATRIAAYANITIQTTNSPKPRKGSKDLGSLSGLWNVKPGERP